MRKLWIFIRQERLWSILCLVIMLMSSIFTIVQAGFIANLLSFTVNLNQTHPLSAVTEEVEIIDKVGVVFRLILDGDNFTATQYILRNQDYFFYATLGIISILFITFTQALFFFRDFSNQYFTFRISTHIRKKFYNQALGYNYLHLRDRQSGDLISRVLNDIKVVEADIYPFLESLIYGPIILIFGLGTMFFINIQFTLILISSFLILGLVIFIISSFFKKLVKLTQENLSDITIHIKNSLENIDVIKIFNRQKYEKIHFSQMVSNHLRLLKKSTFIHFLNRPVSELFITIGGLLILFYSSRLILNKTINITELFSFFSILIYVVPYVQRINNGFFLKQRIGVAMERVFSSDSDHFNENTEGRSLNMILEERGLPHFEGNIEFKKVSFYYLPDRLALEDISFTSNKGEFIAFVGESGSGKTTLLNMIPLLITPQQGDILYDGISYRELSLVGIREHISFVPQESVLFPTSVLENILYGNSEANLEMVKQATRLANIHDVIEELPQGYDTLVGDQGSKLSVGQKQRIAIARALIKNPKILILDEATSALDSVSENLIQESLKKVSKDKTIFAIAHRLTTILEADKIVVMEDGKVVGIGTHGQLLNENPTYKKLYQNQFQQLKKE